MKALIETEFHGLEYSAGLIGSGSEVLGFDTERSTNHHWGPRVLLFLSPKDIGKKKQISNYLSKNTSPTFHGYSTHFGNPNEIGVQLLSEAKAGQPINHRVEIHTIESFFKEYLLIDPNDDLTASDWLTFFEQKLRTIQNGKIFYDQLGLKSVQDKLHYYPKDIWLYMLASKWIKISQENHYNSSGALMNGRLITRCSARADTNQKGGRMRPAGNSENSEKYCWLSSFLKFSCAQIARILRDSLFCDILFLDYT